MEREHLQAVLDSAEEGDPEAEYCAGIVVYSLRNNLDHIGVTPDDAEGQAVGWFRNAVDKGHAAATYELAQLYFGGHGVPEDEVEYYRLKALAAKRGSPDAQLSIARNHLSGEGGIEVNTTRALEYLQSAALGGNDEATYYLGDFLNDGEYGDGGSWATITPDPQEGMSWLRKCAMECSWPWAAYAQSDLGNLYYRGQGVLQDYSEALKWFRLAADGDSAEAQFKVGQMYKEGQGAPQGHEEAARWFHLAAEAGNADARFELGISYYEGRGVAQSFTEATKWFHLVAEAGYPVAQFSLGLMYDQGRGVPQDYVEAAKWYRFAAEQGNASAQFKIGFMHFKGQGVPQDYVQAHKWLNLSASQEAKFVDGRDEVAQKMTSEQIALAQRMAREWRPKSWWSLENELK